MGLDNERSIVRKAIQKRLNEASRGTADMIMEDAADVFAGALLQATGCTSQEIRDIANITDKENKKRDKLAGTVYSLCNRNLEKAFTIFEALKEIGE